jgi:hypothetical protein
MDERARSLAHLCFQLLALQCVAPRSLLTHELVLGCSTPAVAEARASDEYLLELHTRILSRLHASECFL